MTKEDLKKFINKIDQLNKILLLIEQSSEKKKSYQNVLIMKK